LKNNEIETIETISELVEEKIELKWENRFDEIKDYIFLLAILLVLTWIELFILAVL